jgi:hypothetical protein
MSDERAFRAWLSAAVFCERVVEQPDGSVNYEGIYNRLTDIQVDEVTVTSVVRITASETGMYPYELRVIPPRAAPSVTDASPILVPAPWQAGMRIQEHTFTIKRPTTFRFEVWLEGRLVGVMPLIFEGTRRSN